MMDRGDVAIGMALALGAGLATCIGAVVVFIKPLMMLANNRFLAGGLGFSAGIMIFISLFEVLHKSAKGFRVIPDACRSDTALLKDCKPEKAMPQLYALLSCALGVAIMYMVDQIVHKLVGHPEHFDADEALQVPVGNEGVMQGGCCPGPTFTAGAREGEDTSTTEVYQGSVRSIEVGFPGQASKKDGFHGHSPDSKKLSSEHRQKLRTTSIITAIAIAIHNFPEGMVTFVGAFEPDSGLKFELAFAIAMHNIPEGLCVAVPAYYGTGSAWKGFLWALLSGLTEVLGAFIGWIILEATGNAAGDRDYTTDNIVFGILFGIVGGVMVMMSFREILPTAYKYDPNDTVVTHTIMAGMFVMGVSIFLFEL